MERIPILYLTLLSVINAIKKEIWDNVDSFENDLFFLRGIDVATVLGNTENRKLIKSVLGNGGIRTVRNILENADDEDRIDFHAECDEHAYQELRDFLLILDFAEIEAPNENYERRRAAELIEAAGIEVEVVYD